MQSLKQMHFGSLPTHLECITKQENEWERFGSAQRMLSHVRMTKRVSQTWPSSIYRALEKLYPLCPRRGPDRARFVYSEGPDTRILPRVSTFKRARYISMATKNGSNCIVPDPRTGPGLDQLNSRSGCIHRGSREGFSLRTRSRPNNQTISGSCPSKHM
jgi:hypothetical protein